MPHTSQPQGTPDDQESRRPSDQQSSDQQSPDGRSPDGRSSTGERSLVAAYPGLVCDLDGVVYRGAQAVPHAVAELTAAREGGARVVFATNNASRPPAVVAEALRGLGLTLDDQDVLTSSLAGARHLAEHFPDGATVLAIGGPGVADALHSVGLRPVLAADAADADIDAVLQGYGAAVTAAELGEAAYAIQRGAKWVATNNDLTLPTDRGVAPGNGSLVAAVRLAVDVEPTVVGKPGPLLYELAAHELGTGPEATLGIGDRLETDTAGAHAAGMDALHVLTGVHGPGDLVRAPRELRPRYVGVDLQVLREPYAEPERSGDGRWTADGWTAALDGIGSSARIVYGSGAGAEGALESGSGSGSGSASASESGPAWVTRLRLALRVLWEAIDDGRITEAEAVAGLPDQQ